MKKFRSNRRILFIIFLFTIFLGLSFRINFSHAQELIEPLIIFSKFEMLEFSEIKDAKTSVSSISIPLISAT